MDHAVAGFSSTHLDTSLFALGAAIPGLLVAYPHTAPAANHMRLRRRECMNRATMRLAIPCLKLADRRYSWTVRWETGHSQSGQGFALLIVVRRLVLGK